MGWEDRDYARNKQGPVWGGAASRPGPGGGAGGGMAQWWFTTWLLALNIGIFLLNMLLGPRLVSLGGGSVEMNGLDPYMFFSIDRAFYNFEIWRLLTFQFMQWNLMHLFGNMLGLYFFGYMVEQYLGHARYIAFYLICGLGGVAGYLFFSLTGLMAYDVATPMAGASAGIFGILIAAVFIAPETRVMLLFPPIPMKLKYLAWGLLGLAVYMVLTDGRNAGGEAAHLGGAAFGFLLIRKPQLLNWAMKLGRRVMGGQFKGQRQPETGNGTAGRIRREPPAASSPGGSVDPREVDRILMKIGQQGLHSLTTQEKQLLDQATREKRS